MVFPTKSIYTLKIFVFSLLFLLYFLNEQVLISLLLLYSFGAPWSLMLSGVFQSPHRGDKNYSCTFDTFGLYCFSFSSTHFLLFLNVKKSKPGPPTKTLLAFAKALSEWVVPRHWHLRTVNPKSWKSYFL